MREILFKAKRLDNGEWAEGNLFILKQYQSDIDHYYILPANTVCLFCDIFYYAVEVDPDTIGQYTDLPDKNGKKIFEGDIVHILGNQEVDDWKDINYNALIAYLDGGFCAIDGTIENHGFRRYALARMDFDLEVIGNIHDNPELLEVEG